jgi:hypothetical protein
LLYHFCLLSLLVFWCANCRKSPQNTITTEGWNSGRAYHLFSRCGHADGVLSHYFLVHRFPHESIVRGWTSQYQ